jgi:ribonuclease D
MHRLITDSAALAAFCNRVKGEPYLTIDTEFIREKTYWPKLCLVQVGAKEEEAAIDPLAPGMDLTPLFAIMNDPKVIKVMHAGRQDMEIFFHLDGKVPEPVFDTQIAAQVIGLGESVGYEALVNKLLNLPIDKSQRFTDWAHRPLTQKQVDYALGDVIHLRGAYEIIRQEIKKRDRMGWIAEEMEALHDAALYDVDPQACWQRVKMRGGSPKQLGRLKVLAAWREALAQQEDIPRIRIMRDETLADLAANLPKDEAELSRVRSFPQHFKKQWKIGFWEAVKAAENLPKEEWPARERGEPLPKGGEEALELLKLLLRLRAREFEVTPRLVADREELEDFVRGERELHMLTGWRYEVFGEKALALMDGTLSFSFDPAKKDIRWQ